MAPNILLKNFDASIELMRFSSKLTLCSEYMDLEESTYFSRLRRPKKIFVIALHFNEFLSVVFQIYQVAINHEDLMQVLIRGDFFFHKTRPNPQRMMGVGLS